MDEANRPAPDGGGGRYERAQRILYTVHSELHDWVEAGMTAVVCVVLIFTFFVRTAGVDGDSMLPTLHDGDRLLITNFRYLPDEGDIVVVTQPNHRNEPLVKRVIAVGGQTVDIDFAQGVVTVDGRTLDEPYIAEPTQLSYDVPFPQTVPYGYVFVMGDNRNHSWDSRDSHIGMIDARYILGRVFFRLLPVGSFGGLG